MKKEIITIQHTQSQHHVSKMIGAWGGWELTDLGRTQAENIGKKLASEIDTSEYIMYVSDLKRAYQTAESINKHLKIQPIITQSIREVNAGEGNGKSLEWFQANAMKHPGNYDPDFKPFKDAESDRDLWNRIHPFYSDTINAGNRNVIIVSHGTALSFLHSMIIRDKFEDLEKRMIRGRAGSVSKFNIDEFGRVIIQFTGNMSYIV